MEKNKLTGRDLEAIELLAKGLYYKEVAHEMGITVGNARQKIHKIYKKLDASNRTEALNNFRDTDKS